MQRQNQSSIVSEYIEKLMESGMTNKSEIYARVVKDLNVPPPTVRRVAGDLRKKLSRYADILKVEN